MSGPPDLRATLDALTKSLDAAGIPYALCGALALAVYGHPRATKAIDLITAPDQIESLKTVARVHGFVLEALPMTFSSSGITMHRISRIADGALTTIDVLEGAGPLADVWATRERIDTERGTLWVVSRKGLVTMKLAAGRPQDLADLARLEESS